MNAPAYHDADLLLRLYDLRREEKLREARDFMLGECPFYTYEQYIERFPLGSPHSGHWGKAFGFWEMACQLVDKGVLNEELFNACNAEHVVLYHKFRSVIEGFRKAMNYPDMLAVLEKLALRHPRSATIERFVAEAAARANAQAQKPKAAQARKPKARGKASGR